jgi:hypothetical protein
MDDMEFLKKLFLDKEKENMKLKEEIDQMKNSNNEQKQEYFSNQNIESEDSNNQNQASNKYTESNYQNIIPLNISYISNAQNRANLNNSTLINEHQRGSIIQNNPNNVTTIADNIMSIRNNQGIDKEKYFSSKVKSS